MTDKLLPCPFCGKRLERSTELSTRRQDHYMHPALEDEEDRCMLENVIVVDYLDDRAEHGNIQRWNRRAPSPSPNSVANEAGRKLSLWFFRDLSDEQRGKLFGLFGLTDVQKDTNHGYQAMGLAHVVRLLATTEGQP